jgi:phosphatidylglycerophosphate synthase
MAQFAGDKKVGKSLLMGPENRFKKWAMPKLPKYIETYHLTMMTVLWSVINVLVAFPAKSNLGWLWVVNLMIIAQYVTDLFDGELGRMRNTGLIKWGFYMDHLLDYLFLCSMVFVGYMISPPGLEIWYFALLVILGSFMVNSFLSFAATNEFEIYHYGIGPTETRIVFILINTYIIFFGREQFYWQVPAVVSVCFAGLLLNIWMIHKKLWKYDMKQKKLLKEK